MKINLFQAKQLVDISLLILALLSGCSMKDDTEKFSTDLEALKKIIDFNLNPTTVKWEIFGTPEYTGGVPGPTDYVTLIAEFTGVDEKTQFAAPPAGEIWIAPESKRPWISAPFNIFLQKIKNTTADISKYPQCSPIRGVLKQSNEPVKGFACKEASKVLVYLTIADYTKS